MPLSENAPQLLKLEEKIKILMSYEGRGYQLSDHTQAFDEGVVDLKALLLNSKSLKEQSQCHYLLGELYYRCPNLATLSFERSSLRIIEAISSYANAVELAENTEKDKADPFFILVPLRQLFSGNFNQNDALGALQELPQAEREAFLEKLGKQLEIGITRLLKETQLKVSILNLIKRDLINPLVGAVYNMAKPVETCSQGLFSQPLTAFLGFVGVVGVSMSAYFYNSKP